jgi:SOS response regulatory protein OraA/RecX
MATLTALRRSGPGRVALEVDGRPWRAVPDDVVVRCGLHAGLMLDRPRLRLLRTELRRAEALEVAGRALARAPLARRRLAQRLHSRGVAPAAERDAVGTLAAAGLVDDARLARERAHALADRGWGDLAIAVRLERAGFGNDAVRNALDGLAPERERAAAAAAKLGRPRRRAWGALARRGFSPEALEDALGSLDADGEPG